MSPVRSWGWNRHHPPTLWVSLPPPWNLGKSGVSYLWFAYFLLLSWFLKLYRSSGTEFWILKWRFGFYSLYCESICSNKRSQEVLEARSPDPVILPPLSELRHLWSVMSEQVICWWPGLDFESVILFTSQQSEGFGSAPLQGKVGFQIYGFPSPSLCTRLLFIPPDQTLTILWFLFQIIRWVHKVLLFLLCVYAYVTSVYTYVCLPMLCAQAELKLISIYSAVTLHLIFETVCYGDSTACPVNCTYLCVSSPT